MTLVHVFFTCSFNLVYAVEDGCIYSGTCPYCLISHDMLMIEKQEEIWLSTV